MEIARALLDSYDPDELEHTAQRLCEDFNEHLFGAVLGTAYTFEDGSVLFIGFGGTIAEVL